jgi:hypothetical protein
LFLRTVDNSFVYYLTSLVFANSATLKEKVQYPLPICDWDL